MVTALFTSAEFKTYNGIASGVSAFDTDLAALATQVSTLVTRWCRREDFGDTALGTITETYNGSGTSRLLVRHTPIIAVTSVHVDAARTFGSSALVASTDYVADLESGIIEILPEQSVANVITSHGRWPRGTKNVQVIYTAGYTSIPDDLKLGAMLWAAQIWNRRRHMGIINQTVGGEFTAFQNNPMPPEAKQLLSPFMKVAMVGGYV